VGCVKCILPNPDYTQYKKAPTFAVGCDWLAFAVLVSVPIFVETMIDVVTGSHHISGDKWVGLVVPPVLVLAGTVLPKLGWLLGKKDRQFIVEHMKNTLAARIEAPES
jgi:hypothetical protein